MWPRACLRISILSPLGLTYASGRSLACDLARLLEASMHDPGPAWQGWAAAMKAGITKEQMDTTVGLHPTSAEEFVTMYEPTRVYKDGKEQKTSVV